MDLEGCVLVMTRVIDCRECRIGCYVDRNCNHCYTNALFVQDLELWYMTFQG